MWNHTVHARSEALFQSFGSPLDNVRPIHRARQKIQSLEFRIHTLFILEIQRVPFYRPFFAHSVWISLFSLIFLHPFSSRTWMISRRAWDSLRKSAPGASCLGSKEPGPVCSRSGHGAELLIPQKGSCHRRMSTFPSRSKMFYIKCSEPRHICNTSACTLGDVRVQSAA